MSFLFQQLPPSPRVSPISKFVKLHQRKVKQGKLKNLEFSFKVNDLESFEKTKDVFMEAFIEREAVIEGSIEAGKGVLAKEWKYTIESAKDFIDEKKKFYLHVVKTKDKGIPVAFAHFFLTKDWPVKEAFVNILAVHPDYQGRGLGSLLIFSIFHKYPQVVRIELLTSRYRNEKTRGFYKRLGFVEKYEFTKKMVLVLNK
jgi:GNAT superfamily N-acetyltransferase